MIQRAKKTNLALLLILSTITVFAWVGFSLYRVYKGPLPSTVPPEQLEPLDPNFDKEVIESLKKRKVISGDQLKSVPEITLLKPKIATTGGSLQP